MGWSYKPEWPKEPIIIPHNLCQFHDDKFGPLVGVFPHKMKTRNKLYVWRILTPALDCGNQLVNNRDIKLLRLDRTLQLCNRNVSYLIHLGIGHFKNNPYRQRSPYVFMYDDKIYARVSVSGRKYRRGGKYNTVCWVLGETGRPLYSSLCNLGLTKYMGFYEVKMEESATISIKERFRNQMSKTLLPEMT